jgi:DNA-binding transcriptional MerR regulator
MYGPEQLRRLAFVQFMQRLGVSLEAAAAVLDGPSEQWRGAVREQLVALDVLIARAGAARDFLQHAVDCPADHPVDECPYLMETLDRRLAGSTIEQLAAERGVAVPADPPSRTARARR